MAACICCLMLCKVPASAVHNVHKSLDNPCLLLKHEYSHGHTRQGCACKAPRVLHDWFESCHETCCHFCICGRSGCCCPSFALLTQVCNWHPGTSMASLTHACNPWTISPELYSLMKSALRVHVLLTTSLLGVESGSTQKKPNLSS